MGETPKLLGDRIRSRREELDIKPADLARAAGCSISAVLQWESNKSKNLKLPNLFAIADALKVEPRWLATGAGPKIASKLAVAPDELEMLEKYRRASPRWRLSLRLLAEVRDADQNEISESVNVLMAKIFAKPVSDKRVEEAYGLPPQKPNVYRGKERPTADPSRKEKMRRSK